MSSGSGKKKVVAAVASPLSPVSITPNPVTSINKTGIKLLIDRSRILNVPSSKTQSVVPRQSAHGIQNVSLIDSNADILTNGSHAGSSTSATTAPVKQKSSVENNTLPTVPVNQSKGGVNSGEMRVKVTGEDRNGQPVAAGGQLGQVKHSLLIRRPSTNRRLTVPTTPETDGINGQQAFSSYPTIPMSDGNSLKCKVTSTNWINEQPAQTISTTAKIPTISQVNSAIFVPVSHVQSQAAFKTSNYRAGMTDVYSTPNLHYNPIQEKVSYINDLKKVDVRNDISSASIKKNIANNSISTVTTPDNVPTKSMKEQIDSVAVNNSVGNASQEGDFERINIITAESRENMEPSLNLTGTDATSSSKVAGEEVISKPSREIKSLQLMQSASKILTEFIADTSSKGKLRKRHSDGSADVESINVDSSVPGTTTQSTSRKRLRRQSTIYPNVMDGKGLATDSCYRIDNMVSDSSVSRGRKGRSSAKVECSLQQIENECSSSTKDGSTDFFTSLNLSNEQNKISEPSFPTNPPKPGWDRFCWRCKKTDPDLGCCKCIRSYHSDCVRYSVDDPNWSCPECKTTQNLRADIESMSKCLGYVLDIITMHAEWNESFNPIDKSAMPHYDKYITRHMDLVVLKNNLAQRAYKAPEEFLADMSWIVHNMSIYPDKMLLLKHARAMQKKSKHEIEEIEPCHECYIHANTQSEHWFKEPCSKPHLLVWAKLKGYPYWPGKLYMINNNNQAYVRFFATHDRSWLPVKDCFLYSQQDPNPSKNVKSKLTSSFANSVKDIEHHITRLQEQFSIFNYGPFMELVDPLRQEEQQRAMLPGAYLKKVKVTIKRSEGEMVAVASSTNDEVQTLPKNKVERLEAEKRVTIVNKEPAKKGSAISPPRKRMTRRMSRILRNADELSENPLINTEYSQEVTNVPNASLKSNGKTDKAFENNQSSDRTTDKIELPKSSDFDPKNLSLLLRRGSQSWETEPLSKRRKSTIDKTILASATSKTNPTAPCKETATKITKNVEQPIAEKSTYVKPMNEMEVSALPSAVPEANSKTMCIKAKEPQITLQKDAAESVVVNVPLETISHETKNMVKENHTTIQQEVVAEPVPAVVTFVPVHAPIERHVPPATNTLNATKEANIQHGATQVSTVTLAPDSLKSAANSSSFVTASKAQNCSAVIQSVDSGVSAAYSTTLNSTIASKDCNANNSTEITIKQEIISVAEGDTVELAKEVLQTPKEQVQDDNSSTLDTAKEQTVSAVSSENVCNTLLPTPPVVLETSAVVKAGDSNSASIPIVRSNQRARKSFPGGAGANVSKTPKQAGALGNVLPSSLTLTKNKSAIVSIPKELVTPSEELSLISAVDNVDNVCASTATSNQEDDVMIVEETPPAITSREWKMNKNHQLPPPLAPKPPEMDSPLTDSSIDLNNSMQIFDDSSNRVVDHIRMVMEDMLKEMSGKGSSLAELAIVKLNLERQNDLWRQEKQTLQQEFERKMADLRISLGQEKERSLKKQRSQLIGEKERAVHDAKMKQWCKKCYKEASYYCCWNTAYCSEKCQLINWPEHQKTHSPPGNIHSGLQPSFSNSNLIVASQPDNNAAMRNQNALSVINASGSGDTGNVTKRSPVNRVAQHHDITPTSTPLQTSSRFLPGTMAGSTSFKTPIIQPMHGRDSIIIKTSQHSAQNGGNPTSTTPITVQQQLQLQKKNIARDRSNQPNHQNAVYVSKKTNDTMPSTYQSPTTNALKVSSSAYISPTTLSDEIAGSSLVASSAWNNMAMLHPTTKRQMHSGTAFSSAGSKDGTQKGQRHQLTITSIVQQAKSPSSTTYMRHPQ